MQNVDDMILRHISSDYMTVKQISEDLSLPYLRVAVRIKQLRKKNSLIFKPTNQKHVRGVKPLSYRAKYQK